ncbi:MAG: helix-turn-helix domain-containing protein [Lachnospiraceae bacterium]
MSKIIQDVSIGTNIQKLRKAKGFTQKDLCAKLDLASRPMIQSTLAQIETGSRNIFASDLIAIKRILGISFDELFEGLEPIKKSEDL